MVFDGLNHDNMLIYTSWNLHSSGFSDTDMRHVSVSCDFVAGVNNNNTLSQFNRQDSCGFSQQCSLANTRFAKKKDGFAR